jgi:hypothetical protein
MLLRQPTASSLVQLHYLPPPLRALTLVNRRRSLIANNGVSTRRVSELSLTTGPYHTLWAFR